MDSMWIMITTISAIGGCIPIVAIWSKHRETLAKIQAGSVTDSLTHQMESVSAENRAMGARLQVLERIVTDKGYTVASQIDALRDQPAIKHTGTRHDSSLPLTTNIHEGAAS